MAIDTLTKRSAALRYGRGRTRQPEAASTAFIRGAGLGLYAIVEQITAPNDGWRMQSRSRVAIGETRSRLSIAGFRDRVWIANEKAGE